MLDDVLYFSSNSDNIVSGKEDDEEDDEEVPITNTNKDEVKVEETIVVEEGK